MSDLASILRDLVETREIPEKIKGIPREIHLETLPNKAISLCGVRRCGKSTLMSHQMANLRQKGVPRKNILHIDFFDERLAGFQKEDFQTLYELFQAQRDHHQEPVYAFFDEIQEVDGWEGFVHRMQQTQGWQIYVTGSSSKLLSHEISTRLRGRSISYELFPFSFREFLRAGGYPVEIQSASDRAVIIKACEKYLWQGSFPELTGAGERLRVKIHQEYFQSILQRDLILRLNTGHPAALRDLSLRLMHDNASLQSLNRLTQTLKAMGHSLSKNFVNTCLEGFHDAYLFFPLPLYTNSHTKRQANPKKWYTIDTGLVRSVVSKYTADSGRLLETVVFLHLRRQGLKPCYYRTRSGREVDFAHEQKSGELELIQVCLNMNEPGTQKRELSAMEEAITETGSKKACIVTLSEEGEHRLNGVQVPVLPLWRFLL